jgi:hypothetical protein
MATAARWHEKRRCRRGDDDEGSQGKKKRDRWVEGERGEEIAGKEKL